MNNNGLVYGSSGKSVLMPFVDAPKGQNIPAQGNALGIGMIRTCALKGHDIGPWVLIESWK